MFNYTGVKCLLLYETVLNTFGKSVTEETYLLINVETE
jgi:hypothetical protein